jgi:hypothetical protein
LIRHSGTPRRMKPLMRSSAKSGFEISIRVWAGR